MNKQRAMQLINDVKKYWPTRIWKKNDIILSSNTNQNWRIERDEISLKMEQEFERRCYDDYFLMGCIDWWLDLIVREKIQNNGDELLINNVTEKDIIKKIGEEFIRFQHDKFEENDDEYDDIKVKEKFLRAINQ